MQIQIIKLYQSGLSMMKIANQLKISSKTVYDVLKINNIESRRKHHKINEAYFDNPNIEQSAYWAGFIAADGYIYNPSNCVRIELNIKDRQHLEILGNNIGKNVTDYPKHNSCKLTISSKKIVSKLQEYNIIQNKSLTLQFPTNIDKDYIHHYIRGYIDGDGCLYDTYQIVGKKEFLQDMVNTLPFECKYTIRKQRKSDKQYLLYISKYSLKEFSDYIYKDATIYLSRKRYKQ